MVRDLSNKAESDLACIRAKTLKKRRMDQTVIVTPIISDKRREDQRREGVLVLMDNKPVVRLGGNGTTYSLVLGDEVSWYDTDMNCVRYRYSG